MRKILTFLFLFNGIISTFASCPDTPILPKTPVTTANPFVITPASKGMSNFPESTKQLTIFAAIQREEECTPGKIFSAFSLTVQSGGVENVVARIYFDCSNQYYHVDGDWVKEISFDYFGDKTFFNFFFTCDLAENKYMNVYMGTGRPLDIIQSGQMIPEYSFDQSTKLYLCPEIDGVSPLPCTVQELKIFYNYFDDPRTPYGHDAGVTPPTLAAYYPLQGESPNPLANALDSTVSCYFGDHPTSPTVGTTPSWDPSKSFVKLTDQGQFLTFPLPEFRPGVSPTALSFSVFAWVKMNSIPGLAATLFSFNSADGTDVGPKLWIEATKQRTYFYIVPTLLADYNNHMIMPLGSWQLVGFTITLYSLKSFFAGRVFYGTKSTSYISLNGLADADTSKYAVLRIGGAATSFIGDIANVRIFTPGSPFIQTDGDTCSTLSNIELGSNVFALSCSEGNLLNPVTGICLTSCSDDTVLYLAVPDGPPASFCIPCDYAGEDCSSSSQLVSSSSRLSVGAIIGISLGCIAFLIVIALALNAYIMKKPQAKRRSTRGKHYESEVPPSPSTETETETAQLAS